ncbi:MAG TPA: DHA2 family efflux MFS transporter permease subunit [Candidatus Dormibacteraeota bacterium]|nr:DHA2 family efflux MFS transporter permease subunit [Candidatus Dormibacteraeota bacterium]
MSREARAHVEADAKPVRWGLPLTVLVVGMFMSILDTDIVNVAVPTMQRDFGATTDQVQWVATIYTLMLGIVVPASGWLGDRYGLDRIYNIALVAFAAGSALCGVAWSLNSLLFFRVVQAIGGGLMPAVSMAMLYKIVPPQRLGVAMGLFGLGVLFAPTVGPTVGGYLVEYVNWRLIFYINVPIGALGLIAALMVLPRFPKIVGQRFDVAGFLTVSTGLFALLLALSKGADWGWSSYRVLGLFAIGALCLAIFAVVELSVSEPLIDVHVFRYPNFTNSLALISFLMAGLFGLYFYIPLFLQEGEGLGALQAGLLLLLPALLTGLTMPFAGKVYDKVGARWPAAVGCLVVAYGTYLMRNVTPDTPRGTLVLWMCVRNFGMGIAFMPIMASSMAGMPAAEVNRASAVSNIAQRVSSAFGLAVMTSLLTTQMAQQYSSRASLSVAGMAADPHLSGPGMLGWHGAVQTAAFGGGLGDLFLVTAGGTALCALLALLLPNKPVEGGAMMAMMEGGPAPASEAAGVDAAVVAPAAPEPEPEPAQAPPPRRRTAPRRSPAAPPVAAAVATTESRLSS